jgi:hypothetical protein
MAIANIYQSLEQGLPYRICSCFIAGKAGQEFNQCRRNDEL